MKFNNLKYFSTVFVFGIALIAIWAGWNFYMQSPWTRDGKIRAEIVHVAPEVSGKITGLYIKDNQKVKKGDLLLELDPEPFDIAVENAKAQIAQSQAEYKKAQHEFARRDKLSRQVISEEDLDESRISADVTLAQLQAAKANLKQMRFNQTHRKVYAPVDGYITNLKTRQGDYANQGEALFGLVDSSSFYVLGYFEETKITHIQPGDVAEVTLFSNGKKIKGEVQSIGRAIYDQNVESADSLLMSVKPNVPWVRLAQRVPIRIHFTDISPSTRLIAGTTCSVAVLSDGSSSYFDRLRNKVVLFESKIDDLNTDAANTDASSPQSTPPVDEPAQSAEQ